MTITKQTLLFISFLTLVIISGFFIGGFYSKKNIKTTEFSHQNFHEKLNFTPLQLKKLIPIEQKYFEQKSFYENQIRQANIELSDIMKKEKSYTPKVQDAVKKIHIAMGHLQEITLIHFFDMRVLLDEKQSRILDDYVTDVMHEH